MDELRLSILATLALYDAFQLPLTAVSVHERLLNPARFSKNGADVTKQELFDVMEMLDALVGQGKIICSNGFYMLSEGHTAYQTYIAQEKVSAQKWKKLIRKAWWLQCVPCIQTIFVSGSMALGNPDTKSDFDVVVIAEKGRLYTCRVLVSLIASLMGARRTRHEHVAPDKFCFNHYLTDDGLAIHHQSLYAAAVYNDMVPIMTRGDIVERFYTANPWLLKYFVRVPIRRSYVRKIVRPSDALMNVRAIGEWLLGGSLGRTIEWMFRRWQQKRIFANPLTHTTGGRVVATQKHLEFHPHSAEVSVIADYNAAIDRLGAFWNYQEKDSGLS